jgi:two-component system, cell cycle sensor histidine kinase and response regulator CckA
VVLDPRAAERYKAFIENGSEALWYVELPEPIPVDLDVDRQVDLIYRGVIVEANDAMARMYGLTHGREIAGMRVEDLVPREEVNDEHFRSFVRSGYHAIDLESKERDASGATKYFLKNRIGIVEDGKLVRAWGTQRDITERKRLEDQLRQAQKMEAIGRLAGAVAHDFNNVLSVILTYADLLDAEGVDPEVREGLQQIRQAAERGTGITRPLLALSRQQVVAIKRVDANEVVHGMEKMLDRLVGEDVEIVTRLAPALRPIRADASAIEQVLLNLAVNARDAMPTGGVLTIETANVDLDETNASAHFGSTPGPHIMIAVVDSGVGMDDATQARIFEPFFTTKEVGKGTGLGLSIVYGLVKQSHGNVFVYSEPGRGTTFKIYLPQDGSQLEETAPAAGPPRALSAHKGSVVLLVDDDPLVRSAARAVLDRYGYAVIEAEDGEQAMSLSGSYAGEIHLLLTDVVMPHLNGRRLAARLGRLRPHMRVLYMSGYTDDTAVRHGVIVGEVAYLQKPFTPASLALMVREALDRPELLARVAPQERLEAAQGEREPRPG